MTAQILDSVGLCLMLNGQTVDRCTALTQAGARPVLVAVMVGDNPASRTYVTRKSKMCVRLGLGTEVLMLPAHATTTDLLGLIKTINYRPKTHGLLIQMPLPPQIDVPTILAAMDPARDVDGFHPVNVGRLALKQEGFVPCTPAGIMRLLDFHHIPLRGRRVVVLGRSNIVGLPLSLLMLHRDATVTICHSHTKDTAAIARSADVLIAAIGKPAFVTEDFIKPGAVVVDVGINRITTREEVIEYFGENADRLADIEQKGYTIIGDVHPRHAAERAGYITPVPGGVGPLTIAMLMRNTVIAAERACQS